LVPPDLKENSRAALARRSRREERQRRNPALGKKQEKLETANLPETKRAKVEL
jgi:hypothetical protein